MEPRLPIVSAKVTLLPDLGGERGIGGAQYRPHIVLGPTSQRRAVVADGNTLVELYLGVVVVSGPQVLRPGEEASVDLALVYWANTPDAYAGVVLGVTFTVREGGNIVGYGRVESRVDP
jgi:hypothetical protein